MRHISFLPFISAQGILPRALLLALLIALMGAVARAETPYEPARGSTERKQILNAVRPLVEVRFAFPVEFVVDWMRSADGWAFVSLNPQRPGGTAIDLRSTLYADQMDYMDGAQTYALLRFAYERWNVVDYAVGPTDVFWQGDPLYRQVPATLLPH